MKQRTQSGKKTDPKTTGKNRPRGRTVYIGERPKLPLIIAAVFLGGLLMLILGMIFSRPRSTPEPAPVTTNALPLLDPAPASP